MPEIKGMEVRKESASVEASQRPQTRKMFVYNYSPGRKTYEIFGQLRDVPGAWSGLLEALRGHVNLLSTQTYRADDGTANFIGFAEALSENLSPRALADLVTHSPGVISAEIVQDDDGFLVDKFHSRLELSSGEPYVLFPVASFSAMVDSLVDVFGSGGAVIVYQEGLRFGRNDGKILASLLGRDKLRDKITVLPHLASAMGMGLATLTNPDSGELYRLRIEDCFECSTHGNLRRSCDFFRGTIAGLGSEALQMKVECEEVSCRLEGDQWCEFVLRPSPEASR